MSGARALSPSRPAEGARSPWAGFSAVAVGTFMATLDGSIVSVALPSIRLGLGASIAGVELVFSVYLLVISATLLGAGRLGDLLGLRRVYAGGMLLFTLGSGLCGFAGSLPALVAARALQALGASAMMALAPAAVTAVFPGEKRGRALGGISSVVAAGLSAGPAIGGFIVQHFSWPAVFLVNIPVGIAGAFWARRTLPGGALAQGARFDGPGAFLFGGTLAAALGAIETAPASRRTALLLAAAAAAGAMLLARVERRAGSPLVDASLFRDRAFSVGLAAGLLSYAAMFTQMLLTPFYLSQVKGLDPGRLGVMLMALPLALSVTSPVAGWLSDRLGPRLPCLAGAGVLAAGLSALAAAGEADSLPSLAARLAALGVGMGLFQPPNNSAVMGTLPRQRLGSGGGLLATARNLGMAVGVTVGASLFAARGGAGGDAVAFLGGWRLALAAGAALAAAAGLLSLVRAGPRGPA